MLPEGFSSATSRERRCERDFVMEVMRLVAVLLVAPFVYFAAGIPWSIFTRQPGWAPLWGVGVIGLSAEVAAIFGADVPVTVIAVLMLHVIVGGWLTWQRRTGAPAIGSVFADFAGLYGVALIPLVAAPFALPGGWGGDWLVALGSGEAILHGTPFTPELLARPPLFGAASIPALLLGPTMGGFQVFCAVASACALQLFRSGLKPGASPRLIWILAGSIFFLQISANAWPKLLSAAFLFAAWHALEMKTGRRLTVAGAMMGLAIATHQSAILFVPLLLTRLNVAGMPWRQKLGEATAVLALAALVVAPWEIHTLLVHGWAAKIQANPAVSQRLAEVPVWLNILLVGVTTVIAWSPLEIVGHWVNAADRFSLLRLTHDFYWTVTETFNVFAGSLVGLLIPWWAALGSRDFGRRLHRLWRAMGWLVRGALAFALAGQMVLNPFYSSAGSLQTGWVPVGMALALWFARELSEAAPDLTRVALHRIAWLNAGPWLAFNVGLTAALTLSAKFRAAFFDSDLRALADRGWASLGMAGFPGVQILLFAVFILAGRKWRSRVRTVAPAKANLQPL